MGQFFDLRTSTALLALQSALVCLPLLYLTRVQKVFPGTATWAVASACAFCGLLLLSLQGLVANIVGVVAANVLLLGAYLLLLRGLCSFVGRRPTNWLDASTMLALIASFLFYLWIFPSLSARIVAYSLLAAFVIGRSFAIVVRGFPRVLGRGNLLLSAGFASIGAWLLFRGITSLLQPETGVSLMSAGAVQQVTLTVSFVSNFLIAVGLITSISLRLQRELGLAQKEVETLSGLLPICSHCKKIRQDDGAWLPVEVYVGDRSEASFSHTICPDCMKKHYSEYSK
jgi:hypothetical protein